jgi:predicted small integral membrane protein
VGGAIAGSFIYLTELVTTGIADGETLKVSGGAVVGYTPAITTIGQRLFNSLLGDN